MPFNADLVVTQDPATIPAGYAPDIDPLTLHVDNLIPGGGDQATFTFYNVRTDTGTSGTSPTSTVNPMALLPSIGDVPGGLVETGRRTPNLPDVVANYTDPADTTQRFAAWGWQGNAVASFALPVGPAGAKRAGEWWLRSSSIHRFVGADEARAALDFSLTEQASGTALREAPRQSLGEYTRVLYGSHRLRKRNHGVYTAGWLAHPGVGGDARRRADVDAVSVTETILRKVPTVSPAATATAPVSSGSVTVPGSGGSAEATLLMTFRGCPEGFNPASGDFSAECTIPLDAPDAAFIYWGVKLETDPGGMHVADLRPARRLAPMAPARAGRMDLTLSNLTPVVRDAYQVVGADDALRRRLPRRPGQWGNPRSLHLLLLWMILSDQRLERANEHAGSRGEATAMMTPRPDRFPRRRLVAWAVIGGAAVLTAGQLLPIGNRISDPAVLAQDSSSGVPMFRGNAARTGEMPGPGPDDANGVDVLWTYAAGDDVSLSSPAVVKGAVYMVSREGILASVRAEDGTERWQASVGDASESSPAVVEDVVYVGSDDGNLHAIDAQDGTHRWQVRLGDRVPSSPAVVGGLVYVGSMDDTDDGYDGNFYALSAEDGTERWRFSGTGAILSAPAVVDGVVYIGSENQTLYAVNAEDGTERWRFSTGEYGIYPSPVVANGVVYVSSGDPLVRGGGTDLFALNADTGTERWRFSAGYVIAASPAVVDGVVYIAGMDLLHALNADDGTERWRVDLDSELWNSPAVVNGVVYMGTDSSLHALNADDGTERWRVVIGYGSPSSPAIVDGVVYTGCSDGTFYAIGARGPKLSVGGTARVTEATALRGGPAPTAVERAELEPDTVVTITDVAEATGDVTWWPVKVDDTGDQGWVEASKLEPLTSGPESTATP